MLEGIPAQLSSLRQDLKIGASISAALAGLWATGWWQLFPAVLTIGLGIYTILLNRRLPWQVSTYEDLKQLNNGEFSHPALKNKLDLALNSLHWSETPPNIINGKSTPLPLGRWMRSIQVAEQLLNQWIGKRTWDVHAFHKLLLIAVSYPVLMLLLVWWWTGVAQLGETIILPPLGVGTTGWVQRSAVVAAMVFWHLLAWMVWRRYLRQRLITSNTTAPEPIAIVFVYMAAAIYLAIIGALFDGRDNTLTMLMIAVLSTGALALTGLSSAFLFMSVTMMGPFVVLLTVTEFYPNGFNNELWTLLLPSFLLAVAGSGFLIDKLVLRNIRVQSSSWLLILPTALLVGLFTGITLLATMVRIWYPHLDYSPKTGNAFILLFFLGWIPLVNAAFDFISLAATRELLRGIIRSPARMWAGVILDLFLGVALTFGLLWTLFQILHFLQWCGWPVDAHGIRLAFIENPLNPQVSWLAMLAVTNLLPTIWHLVVSLWGMVDQQFNTSVALKNNLHRLSCVMDIDGNLKKDTAKPGLGELELQAIYRSLYVHPWLFSGTVLALVVGFWGSYVEVLRWMFTWLP